MRSLRPAVPLVNVQIGAADGGDFDLDQHVGPSKRRNLDFADLRARRGFRLHYREHGVRHEGHLRRAMNITANALF